MNNFKCESQAERISLFVYTKSFENTCPHQNSVSEICLNCDVLLRSFHKAIWLCREYGFEEPSDDSLERIRNGVISEIKSLNTEESE